LQALVTLNDPVYQECAQALAQRVMKETSSKIAATSTSEEMLDSRLAYETRLVLSRDPTPQELSRLRAFYEQALTLLKAPVVLNASTARYNKGIGGGSTRELDALTAVGTVLLNLDAALTR
jgi:hypothetical protein